MRGLSVLDLHRLRILRELKHRGTLAAVAAALSYAPSSVSQQLSQLEAEAGVVLLERVGRTVRLTPQAELLVSHTEVLLERLERAEAELAAAEGSVHGTVRLAAFQTVALALVPRALDQLSRDYPRLRVEVSQLEPETALPALLAHDFDLVIAQEYPGQPLSRVPQIEHRTLVHDPLRIAVPRSTHLSGPRLRELAGRPWVMEPEGTPARGWGVAMCREAGFEPDIRYSSHDLLLHIRLVEGGHAVALLPDLIWTGLTTNVLRYPLSDRGMSRRVVMSTRRGGQGHPAVCALRTALLAAAKTRG